MHDKTTCPICKVTKARPILYSRRLPTGYVFRVSCCVDCGYAFQDSITPEQYHLMNTTYLQYSSAMATQEIETTDLYKQAGLQMEFIDRLRPIPNGGRVLDIGCGEGVLLAYCKEIGIIADGVEPSLSHTAIAETRTDGAVYPMFFEDPRLEIDGYQLITLRHVLEHVMDIHGFLDKVRQSLSTDGVVYIELPDSLCPSVFIAPYFVPEHISYFTAASLKRLLSQHGFTVIRMETFRDNPQGTMNYPVIRVLAKKHETKPIFLMGGPIEYIDLVDTFDKYFTDRRRLLDDLDKKLRSNNFDRGFWVFGAGYHSEILFAEMPEWLGDVVGFIDNDVSKHGKTFLGKLVCPPSVGNEIRVDRILLSSIHEKEILNGLMNLDWTSDTVILSIY